LKVDQPGEASPLDPQQPPERAEGGGLAGRSFEEELLGLEEAVSRLESGELSLDAAIAQYEVGFKSLRRCYELLRAAQGRVEILRRDAGVDGLEWEPIDFSQLPAGADSGGRRAVEDGSASRVGLAGEAMRGGSKGGSDSDSDAELGRGADSGDSGTPRRKRGGGGR